MATLLEELGVSDIRDAPNPPDGGGGGSDITIAGAVFTPNLHYATSGDQDAGNYASRSASWTQIDDVIHIDITLEMQTTTGDEAGDVTITGIPAGCPAPLRDVPCSLSLNDIAGTGVAYFAQINAGTRVVQLYHMVNGGHLGVTIDDLDAFAKISVSASYSVLS